MACLGGRLMNKWLEGLRSSVGLITGVVAAVTIGYGVIVKAGWVIGRAEAQAMMDLSKQEVLVQLAQAVANEEQERKQADLEFQKDLILQRLQLLLNVEDRSEGQELEVESLKRQLERIESKLEAEA